jgi:hypothetical protein
LENKKSLLKTNFHEASDDNEEDSDEEYKFDLEA